jgi:hypothetical protein
MNASEIQPREKIEAATARPPRIPTISTPSAVAMWALPSSPRGVAFSSQRRGVRSWRASWAVRTGPRSCRLDPAPQGHPWRVIVGWIIVAIAVIATAPALPTTTNEASFLPSSYESIKAQNLQDQAFPQAGRVDAAAAIVVFARTDGGRLTPADKAKVASVASTLNDKHITNVLGITAGPVSPNGLVQTVSVAMNNNLVNGSGTQAGDAVKVLRADIKPLMSGSDLYEGVTGSAAQQLDSEQSGNKAEAIVLFATLLLTARLTSTRTARPPSSSSSCCSASGRTTSCS